jgi:hypothetical protein
MMMTLDGFGPSILFSVSLLPRMNLYPENAWIQFVAQLLLIYY